MKNKAQHRRYANNQKHLFLFLYCSVTLILISIFVFIDRDKFLVDGSMEVNKIEGSKDLAKLAPDFPDPQCYAQSDSASSILDLSLSANSLEELANGIKSGSKEVSIKIEEFLTLREKCGYISTDLEIVLRYSESISHLKYHEIFNSFLEIRRKLKTISPRVNFEITIATI